LGKGESILAQDAADGDDLLYLATFQQLVLERTHDLITVVDRAGTIVYASPSWSTLLGWDPDAVVGSSALDFVHPDDAQRASGALGQVEAGGSVDAITARLRASDGRWVSVDSTGTPLPGAHGGVAYMLATSRDVTEREELRERVREVDALYRVADAIGRATSLDELLDESIDTLLEATGADRAAVLLRDEADEAMRFRAWRRLSDEYRAVAEGHSPWAADTVDPQPVLVSDVSQAGFDDLLEKIVRAEGIGALAFIPLVHGDRLVGKFMLYRDEPYEWSEREVRLAHTIANHLASATIRTMARAALRESRELLETIMDTVDEGVIVQSADGRIVYANDGAARVVGFDSAAAFIAADRQEVLDRFELLDEDGDAMPADELPGRRALRGESSERVVRYRIRATGAERWSIVRAKSVHSDDGGVELAISVIHDITRTRAAAERLRFLARASELLNETLEIESTLAALADIAVAAFAGHVTVDLYDDGVLRCVGARHVDPEKTELMIRLRRKYPPTVPEHPCSVRSSAAKHSSYRTSRPRPRRWRTTRSTRGRSTSSGTPRASSCR
jgi:PAS domain S-box-containing protein